MILPSEYKFISDRIGEAHRQSQDMVDNIFFMKDNLEEGQVRDDFFQEQLLNFIDETYFILLDTHVTPISALLKVVKNMQNLVADKDGDVNPFLKNNNILLNETFASLSDKVGFSIDSENIE